MDPRVLSAALVRKRVLTLLAAIALIVGLSDGQAFARTTPGMPTTPVQHSGSAAGKSHRAPSAVRAGKGASGPVPKVTSPVPPTPHSTPHLSNVHASAKPGTDPARVTSRRAVASGHEDVSQRTANRSVFVNADGTDTARVYAEPIHYRTADGTWADIDTTLVHQPDGTWQEKANSASPVFGATGDSSALLATRPGNGESVAFSLQGATDTAAVVSGNEVSYPGILPDAAVRYSANTAGVKETLVLDNASAPTTWTFPLTLRGLTASLDKDGAVVLTDTAGKVVQTVPHGFMRDSNIDPASNDGAQSSGVTYALAVVGGQQVLRVELDPTWVHDPARVFPIDVDPTSIDATASTYVMSQFRNDYSTDDVLKAGTYDGGTHVANSYLLFHDVGVTFANDYIEAATLNLNTVHSWSCTARPVSVSPILTTWSPAGVKSYPTVSYGASIGQSSFAAGYTGCGAQWESVDLGDNPSASGTKLIEQWAHGGSNLGLAVTASKTDNFGYKEFSSVNTPYAPYLSITYSAFGADYKPAGTYVVPTATATGSQQVTVTNRGRTAWAPGTVSLGYQLFTTSWSRISVGATTTRLPNSVAPNASVTMTGVIGALKPGQYILCWDMMNGSSSFNVTYNVPTSTCEIINSNNTPPQIDSMSPLSNASLGTLTPTLVATGHDPDSYPGTGLTYDFQVYTVPATGAPTLAVDSNPLAAGVTRWTVPSGELAWNQHYYWQVMVSDSVGDSFWSSPDLFSIAVPQPLVTSHLGAAADGRSFDPGVGDYTTSATDAQVAVAGPALSVVRSYNSQDPRAGNLFGSGWSTVYDMAAVPDVDGTGNVVVTYPDGRTVRFGLNSDGTTFTPPQGTYATFQTVTGGGYTLTDRGGTTYTFTTQVGSAWKLTSITDADHRAETLGYTSGQLTTVTNVASGRSLHIGWSGGHPTTVATDAVVTGGQPLTWTYSYTGATLTKVCPPTSATQCTTYEYTTGGDSGSHYRSLVLDAQPTNYWRLGDAFGGTTAVDEISANMGTTNGTYSVDGFGHGHGPAVGSPATSAYFANNAGVTLPNQLLGSSYQTVQLWFQTPPTGPAGVLFSTGTSSLGAASPNTNADPVLYVGTDGKLYGQFWTGSVAPIVSTGVVNDGSWHEVTLVGQGATQSMYVDGLLAGTRAGQITTVGPTSFIGAGYVNANAWQHGPGTGWRYFTGNIGEVAVYAHPLGAPAIAQQYAAAVTTAQELTKATTPDGNTAVVVGYDNVADRATSVVDQQGGTWTLHAPATTGSSAQFRAAVLATQPVNYWPLGESSGVDADNVEPENALESGQSKGDGTYNNVTLGVPGPFPSAPDTAAGFNGSSSSVSFADGGSTGAYGLWFKTTTSGGVLLDGDGTPLLYVGSDGRLHGDFGGTGLLSSDVVTDGAWHYAVLGQQEFQTETLYLDGAVADTATPDPAVLENSPDVLTVGSGTVPASAAAAPANGHFTGSVADVIGNGNVTDDQVAAVYAAAHSASTTPEPLTAVTVGDPGNATLRYNYDLSHGGRLATSVDGLGNVTTFGYDPNGFLVRVTRPDGDFTDSTYDSRGNLLTSDTPLASHVRYTYPAAGTYSATDPRDDKPLTKVDGDDNQTVYTYSAGGDLLTSTNAVGAVTTNTYTTGTEAAVGGGTEPPGLLATQRDPLGHVTTYSYDSAGDLAKLLAASGLSTTYSSDNLGRRTGQTEVSDTFPAGLSTTYSYDGMGRQSTETGPAATDAVTGTVHTPRTAVTYDGDGDVLTVVQSDTTGGDAARTTTNTYNSDDELHSTTDPVGRQSEYGYDVYGNTTSLTDPAGNVYSASYDPNGNLLTVTLHGWTGDSATPAAPTDLVVDSEAYDPDGLLAADTDAMGRVTRYDYDWAHRMTGEDHVITQEDGSGFGYVYLYDEAGNVYWVAGPSGDHAISYTYDAANRVASADGSWGGELPDGYEPLERVTDYTYDAADELTSQSSVNGSVAEETDFTYDTVGDELTQTVHNGTTPLTTSWTYDQRGVQTSMTDPRGHVSGAVAANYTTAYTADALGRTVMTVQPAVNTESQGATPTMSHPITEVGYDNFGDQTSVSDPDGNITSSTYDADGELLGVSQPAYTAPGSTTSVTPTTTYGYTPLGQVATVTDPLGHATTNTYDQNGDLVRQAQPSVNGASPTTSSVYDNDGEVLSTTDPTGAQTQVTYDDIGQVLTTTQIERQPTPVAYTTGYTYNLASYQRDDPDSVTLPGGQIWNLTWDQAGQLLSLTDPLGHSTVNTYDLDLNLVGTTLPDGTATTASYDPAGRQTGAAQLDAAGAVLRSTSTAYDAADNPVSSTDASGVTTTTSYDAADRPTGVTQPVSASSSITTGTGYDAAGQVTRYTSGNGNKTVYTYNSLGLPETRVDPTVPGYTTAADRTTTIGYDADGDQTSVTEPGGVTQTMSYDALGRLTTEAGTGGAAATATRTLGYDQGGRLTSVDTPTGTDTYTYNDRGDLVAAAGPSGAAGYRYDGNDQLTSRTDTTGTATFGYDAAGRLSTAFDPLTGSTAGYSYDNVDDVTGVGYGTGAAHQTNGYNAEHELTSQTLVSGGGATEAGIGYGYDPEGRVTSQTTTGTAGAGANSYTYDEAGRLTDWDNGTGSTTYGYDADGNRIQTGGVTSAFDARDQITSSGSTGYTYTARGTLTSQTTGSTTTSYGYDAFDQLITAGSTTHSYDGLGRGATSGGATFTYDGTDSQPTGDGSQTFGYGPAGQLVSVGSGGTAGLAFTDQHGDVTGTFTPAGGALTGSVAYDPWGQPISSAGSHADLGYQGGWTDPNTGYVATASRWYSPAVGGFTSADTFPINPNAPPVAANTYAYGDDDPTSEADTTGQYATLRPSPPPVSLNWEELVEDATSWTTRLGGAASVIGVGVNMVVNAPSTASGCDDMQYQPNGRPCPWLVQWEIDHAPRNPADHLSVSALQALHGDGIDGISIWNPGGSGGRGHSRGGGGGSGGGGDSDVYYRQRPLQPPPPPPPPLGFTAPINARPTGQSDPTGDIITAQPGTRTVDSGPGDAPVNRVLLGVSNPSLSDQSAFDAPDSPDTPGVGSPAPLPPAQGQLDDAACSGGGQRSDGTTASLICDSGTGIDAGDGVVVQGSDNTSAGKGTVVLLGLYESIRRYIRSHQDGSFDADFLNISGTMDDGKKGVGRHNWTRNKRFIDDAIDAGREIRMIDNPNKPIYFDGNTYQREIKYLKGRGFGWVPVAEYWLVVRVRS